MPYEQKEGLKYLIAGILFWLIPNVVYKVWYYDYMPDNCDIPMFWSLTESLCSVPLLIPLIYQFAFEHEKVNTIELKTTMWFAFKFSILSFFAIYLSNKGFYTGRYLS